MDPVAIKREEGRQGMFQTLSLYFSQTSKENVPNIHRLYEFSRNVHALALNGKFQEQTRKNLPKRVTFGTCC